MRLKIKKTQFNWTHCTSPTQQLEPTYIGEKKRAANQDSVFLFFKSSYVFEYDYLVSLDDAAALGEIEILDVLSALDEVCRPEHRTKTMK